MLQVCSRCVREVVRLAVLMIVILPGCFQKIVIFVRSRQKSTRWSKNQVLPFILRLQIIRVSLQQNESLQSSPVHLKHLFFFPKTNLLLRKIIYFFTKSIDHHLFRRNIASVTSLFAQ